ncbi:MAG: insulinase family protein [Bacteroidales bacterium]|nr:insulinase family protein [Bacteroidales bacterium]
MTTYDLTKLQPTSLELANGNRANLFASDSIELLKLDLMFEAGSAYQTVPLCAGAANRLLTEGTANRSAKEVAEYLDFHGITVEKSPNTYTSTLSVYAMPKYADSLLPLVAEMVQQPAYSDEEVAKHIANRKQHLLSSFKQTDYVARNLFYEALFGPNHPLGRYATADDADRLCADDIRRFHDDYYHLGNATIALAGHYDDHTLQLLDRYLGQAQPTAQPALAGGLAPSWLQRPPQTLRHHMPGAAQTTLRVGCILPFDWQSADCARFGVLKTILGGYFGSRLMTNIREDKGYTYGIYSQMLVLRSDILFFITAEVDNDHADDALGEICRELEILATTPVGHDELDTVRQYMWGDFLRSVDGIFERSERYLNLRTSNIDDQFSANLLDAMNNVQPDQLQALAAETITPDRLTTVVVGP